MRDPSVSAKRSLGLWDWAASILIGLLLISVAATFRDYAISWDEKAQQTYGLKLLDFYSSGFADRSALGYISLDGYGYSDLYYYGGLFDLLAVLVGNLLPLPIYEMRHLLCATIGVLGVAGVWLLGRLLVSPRAGFIGATLLAVTGDWYGGMFNVTKDIPFAVAMVWGVYFLCRLVVEAPHPRLARVLSFGAAVGFSLGQRVGGLLLGLYGILAPLAWAAFDRPGRTLGAVLAEAWQFFVRLLPGLALAYGLMALFWPWSVVQLSNPLRALDHFQSVQLSPEWAFDTVFAGEVMRVYDVPRSYVPVYLAIKLPLVMLIGLVLATGFGMAWLRKSWVRNSLQTHRALNLGLTVFAACFPVIYAVLVRAPAHDGIRHFLFVVPPLAALAGAGFDRMIETLKRLGTASRVFGAGLAVMILWQAVVLVRLHPYQNVDYNALIGGLEGAQNRWVMDPSSIVPEATRALSDHIHREFGSQPVNRAFTVGVCSNDLTFQAVAPPFLKGPADWETADFFVEPADPTCHASEAGKVIYEVRRLGVVLAVVKDRRGLQPN